MNNEEFFLEQMRKNTGKTNDEIIKSLSLSQFAGNAFADVNDKYSWAPGVFNEQDFNDPNLVSYPYERMQEADRRMEQDQTMKGLTNEDFINHMGSMLNLSREEVMNKLQMAQFSDNPFFTRKPR